MKNVLGLSNHDTSDLYQVHTSTHHLNVKPSMDSNDSYISTVRAYITGTTRSTILSYEVYASTPESTTLSHRAYPGITKYTILRHKVYNA